MIKEKSQLIQNHMNMETAQYPPAWINEMCKTMINTGGSRVCVWIIWDSHNDW